MSSEPWSYVVEYESDIKSAFEKLQLKEKNKVEEYQKKNNLKSFEQAHELCATNEGFGYLLLYYGISEEEQLGMISPFDEEELLELFGTVTPTQDQINNTPEFWDEIETGQGKYVVVYNGEKPQSINFVGYAYML